MSSTKKPKPTTQNIKDAEANLRDTERHCGRNPDEMRGRDYLTAISDALASDGFNVDKLTLAAINKACDFGFEGGF